MLSSALEVLVCLMARIWSSVTKPVLETLMVKTTAPVAAVLPSTTPLEFTFRTTASLVAASTRPVAAAVLTVRA